MAVNWFTCEPCQDSLTGNSKPQCYICDDSQGLLKKTSTSNKWIHYTCALLMDKTDVSSVIDMRFEIKTEFEATKLEQKMTRSKKQAEGSNIYSLLLNQAYSIVSGQKDADDQDFTLLRFMIKPKSHLQATSLDLNNLGEYLASNFDFNSQVQKQRKSSKKKKHVNADIINPAAMFGIDTKDDFVARVADDWNKQHRDMIDNELVEGLEMQLLPPGDASREANYCHCFQSKQAENFISCDECQVWYHCSCVGVSLETFTDSDSFVCRKCRRFKELEYKTPLTLQELEPFKRERLNLEEMIILCTMIESAIATCASAGDLVSLNFGCIDLSGIAAGRYSELAVNGFVIRLSNNMLATFDLENVYQSGTIDTEEFTRLKNLVAGCRSISHSVAGSEGLQGWQSFNDHLNKVELGYHMYEEIKHKLFRLPQLVAAAKQVEVHPELRQLKVQKDFLIALSVAKTKLDMIMADFKDFSRVMDKMIQDNDLVGLQNSKLSNSRLDSYRSDLMDNTLALRVVESLLYDLGLNEAEKNTEIPLKLDYFLVILKKELKSVLRAGNSEIAKVWQEKSYLFEKSKVAVQKVMKLKSTQPQWKDIADLDDPETVLATRSEVDRILDESEDSVLVMNSVIVKKLSDLKVASIKFDKKNMSDYWSSYDSSKRYIFNLMKSGMLFSDEAVRIVRELKLHGQVIKFCNHRGQFTVAELEKMLSVADRKFEKDYYDKADLLAQEIRVFVNKATQLQEREDIWDDRVLEECLQLNKKLNDYRIKLPDTLNRFSSITRSVCWLMEIAEQCGIIPDKPACLLRYSFEQTVHKLLGPDSTIDNLNIRTLVRLEKAFAPGVFVQHPNLLMLSTRTAKRVWQKDMEDVIIGNSTVHYDDLQYLLKKWCLIDPSLSSLPIELKSLIDDFATFKSSCEQIFDGSHDLLPLDLSSISKTCEGLAKITGFVKVTGIEGAYDMAIRYAMMYLMFSLKIQKVLIYTEGETMAEDNGSLAQLEMTEITMLRDLINTVASNAIEHPPVKSMSSQWKDNFNSLASRFNLRVDQGESICELVNDLKHRSTTIINNIAALRKDKNISLSIILDEIRHKPMLQEAQNIMSRYSAFTATSDDSRRLITRSIDDIKTLNDSLYKLILDTKIEISNSDENRAKFMAFEKEFLRLLKRAEHLLIYTPELSVNAQAVNCCYRIYKLYLEPATHKKWSKVYDSICETFKQCQDTKRLIDGIGIIDEFTSQIDIIGQLTELLEKDSVSYADCARLEQLTRNCKIFKIGNVDIKELKSDCKSLNECLNKLTNAGDNKLTIDVMEHCRIKIDEFVLQVDDHDTKPLYAAISEHKSMVRLLQCAQKEGYLMNGFLTDFVHRKYSKSMIYSKPIEELLGARSTAQQTYETLETTIRNKESDSYIDTDSRLVTVKPVWSILNKKLQLMAWIRKIVAVHEGKLTLNLVAMECLVSEGSDYFERSKKLIPKDQRFISICIVNKIGYIEELINAADEFLNSLSKCKTVKQLDELKDTFELRDRVDLASTVIDMRTQLSFESIEYQRRKIASIVPAIRESIGSLSPGEVGWDLEKDFKNVQLLFDRLMQNDRESLESRFVEMFESGNFNLSRVTVHMSLDGPIAGKDDHMLSKRKPVKPVFGYQAANQHKRLELISKANDGSVSDNFINTTTVMNLSNVHVDLDMITDTFRENVVSNLLICMKENGHFNICDDAILKSAAKTLEMHLFSNDHRSKSNYQKAYLFLRGLLGRLANYEAISKDLLKCNFSYDQIMQFKDKTDQRLLILERELRSSQDSKYNPLGALGLSAGVSKSTAKDTHGLKSRLSDISSDRQYLSEVLQQLDEDRPVKTSKLMKALTGKPDVEKKAKRSQSPSRSKSRDRSRSSSHGRKKYRRHRDDKSERKKKKDKKKRDAEKAKFSSESEDGHQAEEEEDRGKFSDDENIQYGTGHKMIESSPIGTKTFNNTFDNPQNAYGTQNDSLAALGTNQSTMTAGSWIKINYLKNKIRIFSSDAKKSENQGYSVSCNLNTSESADIVAQFPDFSKVATFVFDKYMKDADEIELHYQRKLSHQKRMSIPAESQTILGGWLTPDEEDDKDKERHKLSYLESYLSKRPTAISYNPAAGVTIWVVMGKWLKQDTLRAIGVKDVYGTDRTIKLDKQIIFFLRRNVEKQEMNPEMLTSTLIQAYDRNEDAKLKYAFGVRDPEDREKLRESKKGRDNGSAAKDADVEKEQPAMEESMVEMLKLFETLNPKEVKELFDSISDKTLKEKLTKIIIEHLPQFKYIVLEGVVAPEEKLGIPRPLPGTLPLGTPFYPAAGSMLAGPPKPMQPMPGHYMQPGFDPSKNHPGQNMPLHPHHGMTHMPHSMGYRPGMPMAPYMVKPPHMMMPMRGMPGPGMPGMPGAANLSHGQPLSDQKSSLPNPTMNTPAGGMYGNPGYQMTMGGPNKPGMNPPHMMYPPHGMMHQGHPSGYQMMPPSGMPPFMYQGPPSVPQHTEDPCMDKSHANNQQAK